MGDPVKISLPDPLLDKLSAFFPPAPGLLQPHSFPELALQYKLKSSLQLLPRGIAFRHPASLPSADNGSIIALSFYLSSFIYFNLSVQCLRAVSFLSPQHLLCSSHCPNFWCAPHRQASSTITGMVWNPSCFRAVSSPCLCFPVKPSRGGPCNVRRTS